ncbi:MAG: hypothetical protein CMJ78_13830, partial [Planctomycetaceae bacterium]|nr:hypothetical protein [Planctomycetaceae bacterium]
MFFTPWLRSVRQSLKQQPKRSRKSQLPGKTPLAPAIETLEDLTLLSVELLTPADPGINHDSADNPSFFENLGTRSALRTTSDDGQFVVFASDATNLVANDGNNLTDIFRYDTVNNTIQLVSVNAAGTASALGNSSQASISGDGSLVVFVSDAQDIVNGDIDGFTDVFVRNMNTGVTSLVSIDVAGNFANGNSTNPVISQDGSTVAFQSDGFDLAFDDMNGIMDVFVRNINTSTTVIASLNDAGSATGNGASTDPVISRDGNVVAFVSAAQDLIPGVAFTPGTTNVFAYNVGADALEVVSINIAGTTAGNDNSTNPTITAAGNFVAFDSDASNLVATDGNGTTDVFVRDLGFNFTDLASGNDAGTDSGNAASFGGRISGDGSIVGFRSSATDLVPGGSNANIDVFAFDNFFGGTEQVSVEDDGTQGAADSTDFAISADGSQFIFRTLADLDGNDGDGLDDLYLRDLGVQSTTFVTVDSSPGAPTREPYISADGSTVALQTNQSGLDIAANDANLVSDVYVYDVAGDAHTLASQSTIRDLAGSGDSSIGSSQPGRSLRQVSSDGRYVVYTSDAENLVTNDNNSSFDVFRFDRTLGVTELVSVGGGVSADGDSFDPVISGDGNLVVFESTASTLTGDTLVATNNIFIRDMTAGVTTLVSFNGAGTQGADGDSTLPDFSSDGAFVVFQSSATDIDADDTDAGLDIYLYDVAGATRSLVSINDAGTAGGNGDSTDARISGDGNIVAFLSDASDLVATDGNGDTDVFVRDVGAGTTIAASSNNAGTNTANGTSDNHQVSDDGSTVVYESTASNIVAVDTNGDTDVFIYDISGDTNTLGSLNSAGTDSGNGDSTNPVVNVDGTIVAFESVAEDLTVNDGNGNSDVFIFDSALGAVVLISTDSTDAVSANGDATTPAINGDGSLIAYISDANDVSTTVTVQPGSSNVYVRDRFGVRTDFISTDGTDIVGADSTITNVTLAEQRVVVLTTDASNLATSDLGPDDDVFAQAIPQLVQIETRNFNNDVTLSLDLTGLMLDITDNALMTTISVPFSAISTRIDILGELGVDDRVVVDFINGAPIGAVGFSFNDPDAGDMDLLEFDDSSGLNTFTDIIYTFTTTNAGTVDLDGDVVSYLGVEDLLGFDADNITLDYANAANEIISIQDDAVADDGFIEAISTQAATLTTPVPALTQMITTSGGGDDVITLNGLDSFFDADLDVQGDTDDTVLVAADTDVGTGEVTLAGRFIQANANVLTDGNDITLSAEDLAAFGPVGGLASANAGNIVVDADNNDDGVGSLTMNDGATIDSGSGTITLDGAVVTLANVQTADTSVGSLTVSADNGTLGQTVNSSIIAAGKPVFSASSGGVGTAVNLPSSMNDVDSFDVPLASDVTFGDADDLQLGTLASTGDLTITTVGITQSVPLTVGGNASFDGGAGIVSLPLANEFQGTVSLNNTGANNLTVNDVNDITLTTSNVGTGSLTVTSASGINSAGNVTQEASAGTVTLTGGNGNVTLTGDLTGAVSATANGLFDVSITDSTQLTVGLITADRTTLNADS